MTRPCLGDGSRAGSWGPPLPRHLARVTFRGRHLRKQRIEKRCETRFPTPSNSIPEDPLKAQTGANSKSSSAAAATPFRSVQQLLAESSLAARPTPKSPAANRRQVVSRRDTRSHPFAAHLQRASPGRIRKTNPRQRLRRFCPRLQIQSPRLATS